MEIYYSQILLKYIEKLKWIYHIMEETMTQLDILCYQIRSSILEMGPIFFFESLAKGVPRTLQTLQASPNVINYPPQHDRKALLLKISLTNVIKH